jgi:hypothetical protein
MSHSDEDVPRPTTSGRCSLSCLTVSAWGCHCSTAVSGSSRQAGCPPFFIFSIIAAALALHPRSDGALCLLLRAAFEPHPARTRGNVISQSAEWASKHALQPIRSLRGRPEDFPLLGRVRGHDAATIQARDAEPQRWPWIDES